MVSYLEFPARRGNGAEAAERSEQVLAGSDPEWLRSNACGCLVLEQRTATLPTLMSCVRARCDD